MHVHRCRGGGSGVWREDVNDAAGASMRECHVASRLPFVANQPHLREPDDWHHRSNCRFTHAKPVPPGSAATFQVEPFVLHPYGAHLHAQPARVSLACGRTE